MTGTKIRPKEIHDDQNQKSMKTVVTKIYFKPKRKVTILDQINAKGLNLSEKNIPPSPIFC